VKITVPVPGAALPAIACLLLAVAGLVQASAAVPTGAVPPQRRRSPQDPCRPQDPKCIPR